MNPIATAPSRVKPLQALYFTQFLSAFADNALLFAILAVLKAKLYPDYYIGIVQTSFLFAYVILAPFVGTFADKHSKPAVLMVGGALKALGVVGLLCGLSPAIGYAICGCGAAVYSPAKYALCTYFSQNEQELLRANSRIEGYTILAILSGSAIGGVLTSFSTTAAVLACLVFYLVSLGMTVLIPPTARNPQLRYGKDAARFAKETAALFKNAKTRFTLIGTGSFWMASSVVRLIVVAWVPTHLGIASMDRISLIVALTAVGIVIGAFLTPRIVPAAQFAKATRFGIVMVIVLLLLPLVYNLPTAVILLLLVGAAGGIYLIPLNSALQENKIVGSGKTIAIQNLVENVLMLAGVSAYTKLTEIGVGADSATIGTAFVLLIFIGYLMIEKRKSALHRSSGDKQQQASVLS